MRYHERMPTTPTTRPAHPTAVARPPDRTRAPVRAACALAVLVLAVAPAAAVEGASALRFAGVFRDQAVLQRDRPIPVWGWAAPGAMVTAGLAGSSASTVCDAAGAWSLRLPALPAGGPHRLTASSDGMTCAIGDVLVGEVWLCAGGASLAMPTIQGASNITDEAESRRMRDLRLFTVPPVVAAGPLGDCEARWLSAAHGHAAWFSGVGFSFARELRTLGVPVGLILAACNDAPCAAWMPPPPGTAKTRRVATADELAPYRRAFDRWRPRVFLRDPGDTGSARGWAEPGTADDDWQAMLLPTHWERATPPLAIDGVLWFRRWFDLPAAWDCRDLTLGLGMIDDHDVAWVNGREVGRTGPETPQWGSAPRVYPVPAEFVQPGRNLIAVRVFDLWKQGGMAGPTALMSIRPTFGAFAPIPLAGAWRYRIEMSRDESAAPPLPAHPAECLPLATPSGLFNGMIAPLIPYGVRGVLWWQGEAEVGHAARYRRDLPAVMHGWREAWGQEALPFLIAQLATHGPPASEPGPSPWAALREAQAAVSELPGHAVAVTLDHADRGVPHPHDQRPAGVRLARLALALVHGQDRPHAGPTLSGHHVAGDAIVLGFNAPNGGLLARVDAVATPLAGAAGGGEPNAGPGGIPGGSDAIGAATVATGDATDAARAAGDALPGFAIAGSDRRFAWAEARIVGDTVVVRSPQVPMPVAVRYAWADAPLVGLVDRAGLPVPPFRTDAWPLAEVEAGPGVDPVPPGDGP